MMDLSEYLTQKVMYLGTTSFKVRHLFVGDCQTPLYVSDGELKRHTEPVWEVAWKADTVLGELQLFSASSDGTVGLWTFTRSEMLFEIIMTCNIPSSANNTPNQKHGLLSLDFNKVRGTSFLRLSMGCLDRRD